MTRILLILTLLFSSFIANAQFKKNDILLGGQLSYSYNSYNQKYVMSNEYDQKTNNGNFTINIGKALNENTIAGINLSYLPMSANNYQTYGLGPLKYQNNEYAAGVFYRKYKSLGKEFYLFGQAEASYYWSDESGKDSTGHKLLTGSSWGLELNFFPGIAYKVSKHFFLELSIPDLIIARYQKTSTTSQPSTYVSDYLTISTSLSSNPLNALGIGFRLIL
jgi:hypothetical protein